MITFTMNTTILLINLLPLIFLKGIGIMKKAIITEHNYSTNVFPMKTICFEGQNISLVKSMPKKIKDRIQSARIKTAGIGKNIQVVMKLSQMHPLSTEFFDSMKSGMSNSLTLSPFRKPMSAASPKRTVAKATFINNQRKQAECNINFSPIKTNNYKFFPKRQLKLKNNNPYKFYMFNEKCHKSARLSNQLQKPKQIVNFDSICTFIRQPIKIRKKAVSVDFKPNRQKIEPWNHKEQLKDDSLIF